jgi:uncharacterized SAM-binding protein YcdF (DUF218 family)
LRIFLRVFAISVIVWFFICCGLVTAVHFVGQMDRAQTADLIIVLGSGLRRDNEPGPSLIRRSQHAADLYRQGIAPFVLCTGGFTAGRTRSEADGCRQVLEAEGVPPDAIVLEERSRSTQENALYAHEIMQANGWVTATLVSDGYHLLRAGWIFGDQGITTYPSPAPTRPRLSAYGSALLRELLAMHWQLLLNTFNLPFTYSPL